MIRNYSICLVILKYEDDHYPQLCSTEASGDVKSNDLGTDEILSRWDTAGDGKDELIVLDKLLVRRCTVNTHLAAVGV